MISVVIPTHNRSDRARALACALDSSPCSTEVEMIFALDGCVDDTRDVLTSLRTQRHITLMETPGLGAAAARNQGASRALGDLILFLDDDIIPQPGMLDAHLASHASRQRLAVVGPCPYGPDMPVGPLDIRMREWWHERYADLADPTHDFTFRDCLTGNLSISARDFRAVKGFDEAFRGDGREDYEFGLRLMKSGIRLHFAGDALAYHYPASRPKHLMKKWYTFGRADVHFALKHPEVFWSLPIYKCCRSRPRHRALLRAASAMSPEWIVSKMGDYFERRADRLCKPRLIRRWHRATQMAYTLGVLSAVGGLRGLEDFVSQWMDPRDLPSRRVRTVDVDITAPLRAISMPDECDRFYAIVRAGETCLDWVEMPCDRGHLSIPSSEVARCITERLAWPIWRALSVPGGDSGEWDDADTAAYMALKERVGAIAEDASVGRNDRQSISPLVLCGAEDCDISGVREAFDPSDIICLRADGDGLHDRFSAAVSACQSDLVALLMPTDRIDQGWAEAVINRFADPGMSAVMCPAIRREVDTRGDELYQSLAGFERAAAWASFRLSDGCSRPYAFGRFHVPCHRLVVARSVLEASLSRLGARLDGPDDLVLRLLHALLEQWKPVAYEPRAVIWRNTPVSEGDVRAMAVDHSRLTCRAVSETLLSDRGRLRACRVLAILLLMHCRNQLRSMRSRTDWPLSIAVGEAVAAVKGIASGLTPRRGGGDGSSVRVSEEEGVTWVL